MNKAESCLRSEISGQGPLPFVPGKSLRVAMFRRYQIARFAALRAFGRLDWSAIDEAAAVAGVTWEEYCFDECIRIQRDAFYALVCWRQQGETRSLLRYWKLINQKAFQALGLQWQWEEGETIGQPYDDFKLQYWAVFAAFLGNEGRDWHYDFLVGEVPAWLEG